MMLFVCVCPLFNFWTYWLTLTKFGMTIMPLEDTPTMSFLIFYNM
jgi:hypothetical protein